jgi:prepilin-type processing-associated H-X9-DG protein
LAAWTLYADDHNDALTPNDASPDGPDDRSWLSLAGSWVTGTAWADTNSVNMQKGVLFPYSGSDRIYRCPADNSTVLNRGRIPRNRHYSMSSYMNPGGGAAFLPGMLPGIAYRKSSTIQNPGPANALVLIDEHPNTMEDGFFWITQPGEWYWGDFPGTLHQRGANLAFADGHVERHRWIERYTLETSKLKTWFPQIPTLKGDKDLLWLQQCIPHRQ